MILPALLFLGSFAGAAGDAGTDAIHFALSKSTPEADATVASPGEIRLWFTEIPENETTSIRLIGDGAESVHVAEVVQDAEDGRVFSVALHGALPAGTYTVSWRAMGSDGHVVRDTFDFTVAEQ
jgi:methionine-rich copper-binding protein CopC